MRAWGWLDADGLVREMRVRARLRAREEALMLTQVRALAEESRATTRVLLGEVQASRRSVTGSLEITELDLDDMAEREVAAALAITPHQAGELVTAADLLHTTLTRTAAMLLEGRLDLRRVQALVRGVDGLSAAATLEVEKRVLDLVPDEPADAARMGPWDDVTAKGFAARVSRAVAEVVCQEREQLERRVRQMTGTRVRVHEDDPALATLTITGPTEQVVAVADAVGVTARGTSSEERAGRTLGQVEVDLLAGAVLDGAAVRGRSVRRELGVVLHVDTLVGDGPSAEAAGQVRCTGTSGVLHVSAAGARLVADQLQQGGASTCVLLASPDGHLDRFLRVGPAPLGGWTRATLVAAARRAAVRPAKDVDDGYVPSTEVADHVRARDPLCTFPGCGVPASRCDLDHDRAWPRGPTSTQNLSPRSRRCHRYKTAGLWRSRTLTDAHGHVAGHHWTSPLGTTQVVEVPVLPGCDGR